MKLSICTDVFGKIPFTEMLDKVVAYGLDAIEMTAGGWGGCNFIPSAEELINDDAKREAFLAEITKRGLAISALNCSGNPLIDTPMGSKTPNWFVSTISWPEYEGFNYMAEGVKYQWKVAGEWWKETCRIAKEAGVKKIAIEEFPGALVHNVRTFNQLCEAVGEDSDVLGLNLDPSHLMIQGAEPIEAAWALGEKICSAQRNWNYVAVGCGRDLQWWKEFFSVCHMNGYDGYVSLEMEDLTMSVGAGLQTSIDALKATISR